MGDGVSHDRDPAALQENQQHNYTGENSLTSGDISTELLPFEMMSVQLSYEDEFWLKKKKKSLGIIRSLLIRLGLSIMIG